MATTPSTGRECKILSFQKLQVHSNPWNLPVFKYYFGCCARKVKLQARFCPLGQVQPRA